MKRLLLVLALVAVTASGCTALSQYAAIVNGEVIEASEVEGEIEAVRKSPEYLGQLQQELSGAGGLQPGGENTINSQYATSVLYNRVLGVLIEQQLKEENLTVSDQQQQAVRDRLRGSGQNSAVFDSLPAEYRDYVVKLQSQLQALLDARNTEEAQRRFFAENPTTFQQTCFRQIVAADVTLAQNIRQRLLAGENYQTLARQGAESVDPGNTQNFEPEAEPQCATGADLSDFARSTLDPVPVNGVTDPIEQSTGVFLVQVTSRTNQNFDQARPAIIERLTNREQLFTTLLSDAEIKVNPKYGEFRPANAVTGQAAGIVAPEGVQLSDGSAPEGQGLTPQFGS